eukprot:CAMPEP_0184349972 /NCGR_PEP_ID=MMETSP1089-20130417/37390_1 /TAXON_ID=38269 ORGANISM="Gloeochaete wittrockiana, Strain SAG46.84" /NCGR_SAMPLE_ID=MMETSP1089 /ASSEMBLY_ACC=CAM_ASM_000445 /LENGTH=80 /DNA_ID=CAMNT_0026682505 /DNA_START=651 /DNA_END=893 /DNA_ORIENTATION=+
MPSPALMIGLDEKLAATSAVPISGWRMTITSAYFSKHRTVSATVSPLETDEFFTSVMARADPPRRMMAVWKEEEVRVEGS